MGKCMVARRSDGGGELASRRNKKARDFTDPFIHKSTLLSIYVHWFSFSCTLLGLNPRGVKGRRGRELPEGLTSRAGVNNEMDK